MPNQSNFEYERTIKGIVQRIAYQLGDADPGREHNGYDEQWIKARVYDTFKWLQGRRPSLFGHQETFELTGGENQKVPDSCDKLLEVLSINIDGKECPVMEADFEALHAARVLSKHMPACALDLGIYHVGISEIDARRFLISPPISPNKDVKVTVTCTDMERFFTDCDKEIDCDAAKWINTVIEYVMWVALNMDSDNPQNQSAADSHRATFFEFAPVQRREQAS